MSQFLSQQFKIESDNWDLMLEGVGELVELNTNESLSFLVLYLNSGDKVIRNATALGLMDTRQQSFCRPIVDRITELGYDNQVGTLVYALSEFDCSGHLLFLCKLYVLGNGEVVLSVINIFEEQFFKVKHKELEVIQQFLAEYGLSTEQLEINYSLC